MILQEVTNALSNSQVLNLLLKDFYFYLKRNIKLGWIDKNNKTYNVEDLNSKDWLENYKLQLDDRLLKTKIGHCWDFVELERWYFDYNHIPNKTFIITGETPEDHLTHTFLVFYDRGLPNLFEASWNSQFDKHNGIKEFDSLKDVLEYIKDLFSKYGFKNLKITQYTKPAQPLGIDEFIIWATHANIKRNK